MTLAWTMASPGMMRTIPLLLRTLSYPSELGKPRGAMARLVVLPCPRLEMKLLPGGVRSWPRLFVRWSTTEALGTFTLDQLFDSCYQIDQYTDYLALKTAFLRPSWTFYIRFCPMFESSRLMLVISIPIIGICHYPFVSVVKNPTFALFQ